MFLTTEEVEKREKLIDYENHVKIMKDWVVLDTKRRREGKHISEWKASFPIPRIGERISLSVDDTHKVGVVATYGLFNVDDTYETAVWLKTDGGFVKARSSHITPLTAAELEEIEQKKKKFKSSLAKAVKDVERQKKERRQKLVKGAHLLDEMKSTWQKLGLDVKETSSFFKIVGKSKEKKVYVSTKGGRVDLSGFNIPHPAIVAISEAEAKARHIGRVRGQIDFTAPDDVVMDAFKSSLVQLETDE